MQIKELSKLVDLPISTIRYYESQNLIQPVKNGYYKKYTIEIKEQLMAIKKLHDAGIQLSDIKLLLSFDKEMNQITKVELENIYSLLLSWIKNIEEKENTLLKSKQLLSKMLEKVKSHEAF